MLNDKPSFQHSHDLVKDNDSDDDRIDNDSIHFEHCVNNSEIPLDITSISHKRYQQRCETL